MKLIADKVTRLEGCVVREVDEERLSSLGVPFLMSHIVVQVGAQTPIDQHEVEEIWGVASGRGELYVEGEPNPIDLAPGVVVFFEALKQHQVRCVGQEPLQLYSMWWQPPPRRRA
jgi:mannose-6-phosphate isomerase-like protein (cupin superfamily)